MLQLTDEEKIQELQTLVSDQRKTISNLAKMNAELSQAVSLSSINLTIQNNKYQQKQDKKIQSYKNKIEELQKFYTEKVRDYDKKIQNMKALLVYESYPPINFFRKKSYKK